MTDQVRAESAYDGGGLAKGGRAVGSGRVEQTQPLIFSADETTDIGDDYGMPVSGGVAWNAIARDAIMRDYAKASKFNGRIDVVQIDTGDDDHSHLIDPSEVARIATARQ
jgi:hypothetical protein